MTHDSTQKKQKTILFLVSSMHGGGAERVAALLCNYWADAGHRVVLMPTFSERGGCVYELHDGVRLDYLADRVSTHSLLQRLGAIGRFVALRKAIRDISPDCIISFLTHNNVAAILAARGTGLPVFVSERSYPPRTPLPWLWRTLRRLTYRFATCVVMQTSGGLRWLHKACGNANGTVIANPIRLPLVASEPRLVPENLVRDGERLIIAVGRFSAQKGFDILLRAFDLASRGQSDWRLVILGDGPLRDELERDRQELDLGSTVDLPGWAGNVADWYRRADVFVLSSRFEGFPNVLLEAMAHGVAAVSFDCHTGPSDLIEHGRNGLLVDESAGSAGLADALSRIMQDHGLRERLAANARRAGEDFSLQRIGAQWDQLIESDYD